MNRREAIQWVAAASATVPLLDAELEAAEMPRPKPYVSGGYGPDPDLIRAYQPGDLWPLTFNEEQRRLVIVLCDIIMPADEISPSASAVGVHEFLDEWISSPYREQKGDRSQILKGLAWLKEKNFLALKSKEQLEICRELARGAKKDRNKFPGSLFYRLRNLVAGGYYTTPAGMKDIGYLGNVPMNEWNGPPPEVLEKLGLKPQ
ncbi:MAG: gluconate 2-dehydrogenase subunit 3 family protein [Limisphaerales bacterium]